MARICLNMIVKNEASIIRRCLAAVAPHIDCYVICDTGSTDDTVEIIRGYFAGLGIPGVVLSSKFVNFEQARNEALDAARDSSLEFDYILLCDADMELQVTDPGFKGRLDAPAYMLSQRSVNGLEYPNVRLLRRGLDARYRGATHEYLDVAAGERPLLEGVSYLDHEAGANRKDKYRRDIDLLTRSLATDPDNTRTVFYLANSYFDFGDTAQALAWYEKRMTMGGWQEEVFYSAYRIGQCFERLSREADMVSRHLLTFEQFPSRAEPLHSLALYMQRASRHRLAYHFAQIGSQVPMPKNALFVEPEVYEWRLDDIAAVALYWLGRKGEAAGMNRRLLESVPESHKARIRENLRFCETQPAQF